MYDAIIWATGGSDGADAADETRSARTVVNA